MTLSHPLIQDYLRELETAAVGKRFSAEIARRIVRYGTPVGARLEHHQRLGRCMARMRELIDAAERQGGALASGTVVLADELTEGSGRFTRYWHAPAGGLWLALAWADVLLPEAARLLPFAAGIACCRTIRHYGVEAALKWVNDVHVDGRKIAGVLCETITTPSHRDRYHLLGLGINVNNTDFPPELRNISRSMRGVLGRAVDLEEFAARLLAELAWSIGLTHYHEELMLDARNEADPEQHGPVLEAWRELSDSVGRRVRYGFDVQRRPLYEAVVTGINREGGLMLTMEDGAQCVEYSGEIDYL